MKRRPCRLCGAEIIVAKTREGKGVGLDVSMPTYILTPSGAAVQMLDVCYVDHTCVCKKLKPSEVQDDTPPFQTKSVSSVGSRDAADADETGDRDESA